MRLIRQNDGSYVPQLTTIWEVEELAARPDAWVPICRVGKVETIGEIHSETLKIRLYPDSQIRNREIVALASGPSTFEEGQTQTEQ
ncbi:hypothetical protein KDA_70830 [Dictyobacter alpinus]|uniref:Uncharacterized protein n=1 Tax=Dictyobacter alpinus TaxID=2014873 RepID=A0A402BJS6_9CHLR|nr:hypothetical protein [Dictyobacter alpinus]GCE31599.1 hypothetical protein KDA_70830 [Dictyobacter alpinus]